MKLKKTTGTIIVYSPKKYGCRLGWYFTLPGHNHFENRDCLPQIGRCCTSIA